MREREAVNLGIVFPSLALPSPVLGLFMSEGANKGCAYCAFRTFSFISRGKTPSALLLLTASAGFSWFSQDQRREEFGNDRIAGGPLVSPCLIDSIWPRVPYITWERVFTLICKIFTCFFWVWNLKIDEREIFLPFSFSATADPQIIV